MNIGFSECFVLIILKLNCKEIKDNIFLISFLFTPYYGTKETKTNVKFIILDKINCVPILGLNTCITLNLIKRINKVNVKCSSGLDNFINENKDIFKGIGTFPDVMKIKLTEGVIPIANPPRRVPLTIKKD